MGFAWPLAFALLIPLRAGSSLSAQAEYGIAWQGYVRGDLVDSQQKSDRGYQRFRSDDPKWASQFLLLEAEGMVRRGLYDDALKLLANFNAQTENDESIVRMLAIESVALTHQQQIVLAKEKLRLANALCKTAEYAACGAVLRSNGILAAQAGDFGRARQFFLDTLSFAQSRSDKFLEASATLNLGWIDLQVDKFDEAMDWLRSAQRDCVALRAEDMAERASGNLGWAYFRLGDDERALGLFVEAEKSAARRGSIASELGWISTAGYVYRNAGDSARASQSYLRALALANQIKSKQDIISSLEDLSHASIDAGKLDDADNYLKQLDPLILGGSNMLDVLDVALARGRLAALRRDDSHAESMFREVDKDPVSDASMRLGSEHELARLFEIEGHAEQADRTYRTALTTFESARDQLKSEDSKLPFLANATSIYDDYIHFLVTQNRADEALHIADQSRAQTLAQGLGVTGKMSQLETLAFNPEAIARKTNATLLFYWLGEKRSYLWVITAKKTALFPLPPHREIAQTIERYRKTLLGFQDPLENANADGLALFRMLVAPASSLLPPGANVVVLSDGELNRLNFETLIVPAPQPHYFIEDSNVVSAPSLHLLAAANFAEPCDRRLLLFGDAVSPNPDYPELPMAAAEMKQVAQHFASRDQTVFARERATALAYLAVNPQQFAYIHFVAHGVASPTDPLDSAIILSRATAAEDSFKLHAREIIQHPLHARLVTISACYGSGTRSYAGEGLVGLAWAFLRAGAHNVIGALWEANDESTAQLMGALYQGLERGMPPSAALRQAKLSLLHSHSEFRKPFYWAPFQMYTGL
ncbi:MAG TPA: CHAT domain-containing protein [Terracidiphilus sp.]